MDSQAAASQNFGPGSNCFEPYAHSSHVSVQMGSNFMSLLPTLLFLGFLSGRISAIWAAASVDPAAGAGLTRCAACREPRSFLRQLLTWYPGIRCKACLTRDRLWPLAAELSMALLFAGFGWLLVEARCQSVEDVLPSRELWQNRLPFHLLFMFLLMTATITDFLDYVIVDAVVLPGTLIALVWATVSGELQMIHVWVQWDYELVDLYGPYRPEWMKVHQHLHGFIWSLCGLTTGAGLMAIVRSSSRFILGTPAVGQGDVTLMGMVGAFMGWQPTLCVLAIAPLVGIVMGLIGRILSGKSFVAFGPYLAIAAFVVLCSWRQLWEVQRLRIVFSHWPTIAAMVGGSFAAFCILLFGLKLFRAAPIDRLRP